MTNEPDYFRRHTGISMSLESSQRGVRSIGATWSRCCPVLLLGLCMGCYADLGAGPSADGENQAATAWRGGGDEHIFSGGDGLSGGDGDVGAAGDAVMGSESAPFEPPVAGLRRLTASEYGNSVADILNVPPPDLSGIASDDSVGGFLSIGARRVALSPAAVESFEDLSYEIAGAIFADESARSALVGCAPQSADDACSEDFLYGMARRFYRRTPDEPELGRLTNVVQTVADASDIWTGLSYGLSAILQSPYFLYRVELGHEGSTSPWLKYDAFERATRLSYLVTGSTPDDLLLDAAESGQLDTPSGYSEQVERLLQSERTQETLSQFFFEHLRLGEIDNLTKDPMLLDEEIPLLMRTEIELLVQDWIWNKERPFSEIFTSTETFVNDALARFYGMPTPGQGAFALQTRGVEDPRVGLLGTAGLLALNAGYSETSPTKRGRYIVERILCEEIPEPPPGVDVNLEPVPEGVNLTMRERVEIHLTEPACAACHEAMDPVGLPLEHFDAAGRYRQTDHGLPIDASGSLGEVDFDGLAGLADALTLDPRVSHCMVEKFYGYALGHQAGEADEAAVDELASVYDRADGQFLELVRSLVQHDAFLFATEPAQ